MTHRIAWLTDIHLDFLNEFVHDPNGGMTSTRKVISESQVKDFCEKVMAQKPDSVVITGDISLATMIEVHLMWLEKYLPDIPVYFVLGNHDYYHGSIAEVRSRIQKYDGTKTRTQWLNVTPIVKLTENTALVGHDGWYDGGYSDWFKSTLMMNEYLLTSDFRFQPPIVQHRRIQELAQECAVHIDQYVQAAAKTYKKVIFATHVPPFRENSRAPDRKLSDKNWLPNMSSKMAGDALRRAARAFPGTEFVCLSGHTHTSWEQKYEPNLLCLTGQADYGKPLVSLRIIEVE
jgi:3',5'-cyclic AMP phosphodiesterase CpdA